MALKPDTSPRIAVAIAHEDELSFEFATRRPVLMRFWVVARERLVELMLCRACMAPTFVRIEDI
jgi:hypothetical protein